MPFGWAAAATIGAAAIGANASRKASKDAANASAEATAAGERATESADRIAARQADLAETQYRNHLDNIQPRTTRAMDRAAEVADLVEARASKQFDFEYDNAQRYSGRYWNTQVPLEDTIISEARAAGSDAEQARQAGLATADTRRSFASMRDMVARDSARRGVNPNSGAAMALARQAATAEALGVASAATGARSRERQVGFARRTDAAALGRGLPGFSGTSTQLANSANNTGLATAPVGINAVGAGAGINNAGFGAASSMFGQSLGSSMSGFNAGTAGFNARDRAMGTAYNSPAQSIYGSIAGAGLRFGASRLAGQNPGGWGFGGYNSAGYGSVDPNAFGDG